MGLYNNVEIDPTQVDPISDSDTSSANLMFLFAIWWHRSCRLGSATSSLGVRCSDDEDAPAARARRHRRGRTRRLDFPLQIQNDLTTIDTVPTKAQLDTIIFQGQDALTNLAAIAMGTTTDDTGIRLRAITALTNYCATSPCIDSDVAHQALYSLVTQKAEAQSGSDIVMLRGAIEALGPQTCPDRSRAAGPAARSPEPRCSGCDSTRTARPL